MVTPEGLRAAARVARATDVSMSPDQADELAERLEFLEEVKRAALILFFTLAPLIPNPEYERERVALGKALRGEKS